MTRRTGFMLEVLEMAAVGFTADSVFFCLKRRIVCLQLENCARPVCITKDVSLVICSRDSRTTPTRYLSLTACMTCRHVWCPDFQNFSRLYSNPIGPARIINVLIMLSSILSNFFLILSLFRSLKSFLGHSFTQNADYTKLTCMYELTMKARPPTGY